MSPFRLWMRVSGRTLLCMQLINLYVLFNHKGRFEVFAVVVVLTLMLSVLIGLAVALRHQEKRQLQRMAEKRAARKSFSVSEPDPSWEWAEHCPRQAEFQRHMHQLSSKAK